MDEAKKPSHATVPLRPSCTSIFPLATGVGCSEEAEAGLPGKEDEDRIILKSILKVLDAAKKLRLVYLEEDEDRIILKAIMYIKLPLASGAGCREEAEAGLPGGGRGQDHPQVRHVHQS